MKFLSTLGILCLCLSSLFAQTTCFNGNPTLTTESFNMSLLANWDDETLPSRDNGEVIYNDIWGYAAPDVNDPSKMREYAIIGSTEKIHIFDITDTEDDPNNLVEIASFEGGASAVWRDFKTYEHYAYCVADEGNEGLIILDLSQLPNTVTQVYQSTEFFPKVHSIFIDTEEGRLYAAGREGVSINPTDILEPDIIVLDLNDTPASPTLVGQSPLINLPSGIANGYVHDIHVKDGLAYCSHIFESTFAIWNLTDPNNPVLISTTRTQAFQHSSWLTQDGKYSIYAEETSDVPLGVIDVSDPTEIQVVHTFKSPLLTDSGHEDNMAHNPFIRGDYLYVAYYEDGVQVFDVSNPLAPTRVGWYDTYRCNTDYNQYNGAWGLYPFFESNKIIASDTRNGLFVVMLNEDMQASDNNALPVELVDFTGTLETENDRIRLDWMTHSETRNVQFFVEKQRATNVHQWEQIAAVPAKGNAAEALPYHSYDDKPHLGNNYYRLAQQDADGKITYSETVVVNYSTSDVSILVYPTLVTAQKELNIVWNEALSAAASIQLFATNGQLVKEITVQNINNGDVNLLNINNLPTGVYTLRIQGEGTEWTERIVKL